MLERRQMINCILMISSYRLLSVVFDAGMVLPQPLLVGLRRGRLGHIMEVIANSLKELT